MICDFLHFYNSILLRINKITFFTCCLDRRLGHSCESNSTFIKGICEFRHCNNLKHFRINKTKISYMLPIDRRLRGTVVNRTRHVTV